MNYSPKQFSNVSQLDLPEAKYTILYGVHIVEQNPEELPEDADYLLLETGVHEYLKDPSHTIQRLSHHVQYKALFEKAEKFGISVVFADLKYKYNDFALLFLDNVPSAVGWFAGMKLMKRSLRHGKKGNLSQAAAMGLFAGWLLLPFAVNALRLGSSIFRVGEEKTGRLKRLSHRLHPETEVLYLTLRNAVIAEKAKTLAKNSQKKPHIAIVLGAGHVGIEDMLLMSSSERMNVLTKFKGILKMLARPEYLFTTLIGEKVKKEWKVSTIVTASLQSIM